MSKELDLQADFADLTGMSEGNISKWLAEFERQEEQGEDSASDESDEDEPGPAPPSTQSKSAKSASRDGAPSQRAKRLLLPSERSESSPKKPAAAKRTPSTVAAKETPPKAKRYVRLLLF